MGDLIPPGTPATLIGPLGVLTTTAPPTDGFEQSSRRQPSPPNGLEELDFRPADRTEIEFTNAQCQCKCAVDENGEPTGEKCGRRPRNRHWCAGCRNMVGTGCCWIELRQLCHRCNGNPQELALQDMRPVVWAPSRPTHTTSSAWYCAAFNALPSGTSPHGAGHRRARRNQAVTACDAPCGSCEVAAVETPLMLLPRCHRSRHRRHSSHVCQQCAE